VELSALIERLEAVRNRVLQEDKRRGAAALSGLDAAIALAKRGYFDLNASLPQVLNDVFVNAETNARGSGLDASSCSAAREILTQAFNVQ
jgi:hypothetical protein